MSIHSSPLISSKLRLKQGIIFIQDILEKSEFLEYNALCEKFNFTPNYLNYLSLVSVIKRVARTNDEIGECLSGTPTPNIDFESAIFDTFESSSIDTLKSKSKMYYDLFIQTNYNIPNSLLKWTNLLQINEQVYYNSYTLHKAACRETKLLAFQYKVIHSVIPTKRNLYNWKILDNDTCFYCSQVDTVLHCLWECRESKKWLNKCIQIWNKTSLSSVDMLDFIFAIQNKSATHVYLITKYFIWLKRSQNTNFNEYEYKAMLKWRILNDQKNLKYEEFVNKWEGFQHIYE